MNDAEYDRLLEMRAAAMNVIGFYELLYELQPDCKALARMTHEVHFATSARSLAIQIMDIIQAAEQGRRN